MERKDLERAPRSELLKTIDKQQELILRRETRLRGRYFAVAYWNNWYSVYFWIYFSYLHFTVFFSGLFHFCLWNETEVL